MVWKKDAPPGTYSLDLDESRKLHDELTEKMAPKRYGRSPVEILLEEMAKAADDGRMTAAQVKASMEQFGKTELGQMVEKAARGVEQQFEEMLERARNRCLHERIAMPAALVPASEVLLGQVKARCRDCGEDVWAGTPVEGGASEMRPGDVAYFMDEEDGHTMTLKRIPEADEA